MGQESILNVSEGKDPTEDLQEVLEAILLPYRSLEIMLQVKHNLMQKNKKKLYITMRAG